MVGGAVVLVVLLPNAGNLGLSINMFAFGDEGVAQAGIYFLQLNVDAEIATKKVVLLR